MMQKASFAMALHLHQPVGNFENVIDRAYKNCYLPLIETLSEYPDIKITLHISGCLLDYFEARYPSLLDKIKKMSSSDQIELLSGGYYEPILISIPERDLLGQIKMMSGYIKSRFNYQAKGMWVPERVWAPCLVEPIHKAGIKYCILDDTHLLRLGIAKEKMYGYFLTGAGSKKIAIFPSDKKLRYSIPFSKPAEVMGYFDEVIKQQDNPLFVYGDDGEKFGEWPGTYKWVYEEKWFRNFLDELKKNSDWLRLIHFSDYLDSNQALGNIQIPEASYDEMMDWHGGSWLNFLNRYPEANQMHKKMYYVSEKLAAVLRSQEKDDKLQEAKRKLYKGQCNCAYWHGVFGGLYLFHLRNAVYNNLIEADKLIDEVMHKKERCWIKLKEIDFDLDGKKEVVMENATFALYIDPFEGGVLKELDYRPLSVNLINTLSRRQESYHQKILALIKKAAVDTKEIHTIHDDIRSIDPSIASKLIYDKYPRYCLRDYFIDAKTQRRAFMGNSFTDLGNLAQKYYMVKVKGNSLLLESDDRVLKENIKISKEISIKSESEIEVAYCIKRKNTSSFNALFGVEFNITMPLLDSNRYGYYSDNVLLGDLDKDGVATYISSFGISDSGGGLGIRFKFSDSPKEIWYFPVKTVSQSERAYELNFQGSCIFPIWKLEFDSDRAYRFKINIIFALPSKYPKR